MAQWIERYASPLNLIDPSPMAGNATALTRSATAQGLALKIFFARKANKALAFVDEALRLGIGVDVASEVELRQVLDRGVPPGEIVVTAAVKPRSLLELCTASRPTVVLDNEDELTALVASAERSAEPLPVALRLAATLAYGRPETRFGLPAARLLELVERHWPGKTKAPLSIEGVHFHLDGYDPAERVTALVESLRLVDGLRERGHRPSFIDIGGGIPISYLEDEAEWVAFWRAHTAGLLGRQQPLTFEAHGLGLSVHGGEVTGRANVYPYYQPLTQASWLTQILAARVTCSGTTESIADALRGRGLQLRCEPGRSLLDGCGMTVARVEFRKQRPDGTWLIGLAMNRTQCRSTSDDFLVDPLLVSPGKPGKPGAPTDTRATGPIEGYLVGAYCIERELLTWRRLRFPRGVDTGDLVVFPNTAGYLMHILESASHQIPLARNLIVSPGTTAHLDPIDQADDS